MKASKVKTMLVLALGFAGLGVSSVMADELGINFSGANFNWPSGPYVSGWEFQVISPVTVDGLASATGLSGMSSDALVGLWKADGTLLASGTVPSGTPVIPGTEFAEVAITPITLNPGFYVVASTQQNGNFTGEGLFTGLTVAPGIQYVTDEHQYIGNGGQLVFPTLSDNSNLSDAGYFGGNIVLSDNVLSESVPDLSSSLMLLSGVCMALDMLRRKLQS